MTKTRAVTLAATATLATCTAHVYLIAHAYRAGFDDGFRKACGDLASILRTGAVPDDAAPTR